MKNKNIRSKSIQQISKYKQHAMRVFFLTGKLEVKL
jgi:hypothetical protein